MNLLTTRDTKTHQRIARVRSGLFSVRAKVGKLWTWFCTLSYGAINYCCVAEAFVMIVSAGVALPQKGGCN
ncbi:MAG TPA: hypothetical protein VN844_15695 [Pyrinomonadaceae bacterium]|nr:hypothetical protein [Pyrinomonadaceae bacterium]